MKINLEDTITAISTPLGEGGIGIVRLSGPEAITIAARIFRPKNGQDITRADSFTIHYGHIIIQEKLDLNNNPVGKRKKMSGKHKKIYGVPGEEVIDEVLVTVMRAPRTYTRQDVVEINCHAGIVPLKKIMDLTLVCGARIAEPGEFTQRAFLNGRLDLCQAEAVLDVIQARTDEALSLAVKQLKGRLSDQINDIRDKLLDMQAQVTSAVDFPEEDLQIYSETNLGEELKEVMVKLKHILSFSQAGMILRQGIMAVILGRPNVGKSSLMNAILKQDRVIVTPVPGTTRDAIEEVANIKGIPVRMVDTAGLRSAGDQVEEHGINRAREYLAQADLVLLVFDAGQSLNQEDLDIIAEVKKQKKKMIIVLNKIDQPLKLDIDKLKGFFTVQESLKCFSDYGKSQIQVIAEGDFLETAPIVQTSAIKMEGINDIEDAVSVLVWQGRVKAKDEVLVSNLRHKQALEQALKNLTSACSALEQKLSAEFISLDIKEALDNLGLIVGQTTTEDLLEHIFSNFCIGK